MTSPDGLMICNENSNTGETCDSDFSSRGEVSDVCTLWDKQNAIRFSHTACLAPVQKVLNRGQTHSTQKPGSKKTSACPTVCTRLTRSKYGQSAFCQLHHHLDSRDACLLVCIWCVSGLSRIPHHILPLCSSQSGRASLSHMMSN